MPDAPEPSPLLDLTDLRLMPQWVSDFSKAPPRTDADHTEDDTRERRGDRDRRGPRDDRRGGGGGFQGDRRAGGPPRGERKPFERPSGPRPSGPRPEGRTGGSGDRRDDRRSSGPRGGDRDRRGPRDDRRDRPQHDDGPRPVPGISVSIEPESKSTEAMAAMIRTAGKAYSVFDAARLVLASGDRFHVKFTLPSDSALKFHVIPADGSVWMSKEEAISNFLHGEGLNEFYRVEEVELEEPKGNFTSVAVCGMSGEILGPPSHHSYQHTLHKIHRERFANMSFEDYKRRVRNDNTPETIQKWKDSQKHGVHWVYLSGHPAEGEEQLRLKSRSEMESHFRKTHGETLIHETNERVVMGNIPKKLLNPSLYIHLRRAVDEARKHLLSTAQQLCAGFEGQGLKLFKRRGGKLWVSRTRPRALDSHVVLADRITRIVEIARTHPGITTKELIETIAPTPAEASVTVETPVEAPAAPVVEETPATESVSDVVAEAPAEVTAEAVAPTEETSVVAETSPEPAAKAPESPAPHAHPLSDAQMQVLKDLHWLNSEGYVIEYSDGVVYPGVTEPPPAKPKPVREPKPAPSTEPVEAEAPATTEAEAEPESAEAEGGEPAPVQAEASTETAAPAEVEETTEA